jgi:glycosyltransferase involved in cell wall biosynthesis
MTRTEKPISRVGETGPQWRPIVADITVVIPTVGRPILTKCLQSIASGTVWPARTVVVDQGEGRAVLDLLRGLEAVGLEICHMISADRSPASARNQGIDQATTPFVAAIDDDCVAANDWLGKMAACLHQNPEAIITGRLEAAGEGRPPTVVTSTVPCVYTRPSLRIHSPLASANMGFARETARRIGPFDEQLSEAEDNDWAYRALRAGIPIVYAPELVVHHYHWRDSDQLTAAYRAYAWSQGVFYGKHLRRGDWSMAVRAALSLYRGARDLFAGAMDNNARRRVNGRARMTRLVPGLVAGLRGMGSP